MSANNYYNGNSQTYATPELPHQLRPGGVSQQSSYAPSTAPSYHSTDPYEYNPRPPKPYSDSKQSQPYADDIPMKSTTKLNTLPDPRQAQNNAYPPSPESQIPNEALLPPRTSRKKKKGGFFSGKVPWFVYIMTLIQLTVFIVEIIKNCKLLNIRS